MHLTAPNKIEQYEDTILYRMRHSCAHIMAQAVLEIFPDAKLGIGPPIEDGFYYDFDLPQGLSEDHLQKIESRMRQIIRDDFPFVRREITADEGRRLFAKQPYKLELIEGLATGAADEYGAVTEQRIPITTYQRTLLLTFAVDRTFTAPQP